MAIFKDRVIVTSCILYASLGFTFIMFEECWVLWILMDNKAGGLSFTSAKIGLAQAICGVYEVLFALLISSKIVNKFGLRGTFRLLLCVAAATFLVMPNVSYLSPEYPFFASILSSEVARTLVCWTALMICFFVYVSTSQLTFTAVQLCINNSAESERKGAANGLGQTLVAFARTFGPAISGVVLAFTASSGLPFPFDYRFVFICIAVCCLALAGMSFLLPSSIEEPRDK